MNSLCRCCGGNTEFVGIKKGVLDGRDFRLLRCGTCWFSFIENDRRDFKNIYNKQYYEGYGADTSVDYVYELENPESTIRNYEMSGVTRVFEKLNGFDKRCLDYGCGGGLLVRFARKLGIEAIGFEDGWGKSFGNDLGIPIISRIELDELHGQFDFISAIEVLEHVHDPITELRNIRKLLKPGGILFLTTGSAQPWRGQILKWKYTDCPDIHISFFEPETLAYALEESGFEPRYIGFSSGMKDIIKFKILKTLGVKNRSKFIDLAPWWLITRIVNARHKVTSHPIGVAK